MNIMTSQLYRRLETLQFTLDKVVESEDFWKIFGALRCKFYEGWPAQQRNRA